MIYYLKFKYFNLLSKKLSTLENHKRKLIEEEVGEGDHRQMGRVSDMERR
jgi:hypothetical protein